jgi:1,4-dihydroxy-2-naphthoate octaprenyltransferase
MSIDLPVERKGTKTGTLRAWIEVQKLPRHFNDVFSFVLGSTLAWYHAGRFDWNIFIVGLAAVFSWLAVPISLMKARTWKETAATTAG